jgi:hypothetical protein
MRMPAIRRRGRHAADVDLFLLRGHCHRKRRRKACEEL